MLEALSTVKGVKSVTSLGCKEPNSYDFLIEPKEGADVRRDLFERVSSRGKTLLSLSSNKISLEQVFLRLTEAGSYEEARKLLGFSDVNTVTSEEMEVSE